jgi:hypothetical protein
MHVLFISTIAVVVADPPQSRKLFIDALGLPLEGEGDGYYASDSIAGSNHFGVWPLSQDTRQVHSAGRLTRHRGCRVWRNAIVRGYAAGSLLRRAAGLATGDADSRAA